MSYKILDCSTHVSDALRDGVTAGVFDECSVSVVGKRVEIAKGKLLLNGIPVIIDGREIIAIPDDYDDGNYYVVGVMKIEDWKPVSFYLSLRDGLNLRRDGIQSKDGIIEYGLVEIGLSGQKIVARRILPIIREKNCQKNQVVYLKKGFVEGVKLNILDATDGEFSKISILARTTYTDGKYVGSGDFTLTSTTGNLLDVEGLEVRDVGFMDGEKFVTPQNIWGAIDVYENGFSVCGQDSLDVEETRGVLNFNIGKISAGTYYLSFKAKPTYLLMHDEEMRNVSVEIYANKNLLTRYDGQVFEEENVSKEISTSFKLEEDSVVEFKVFVHGHTVRLTDFCMSRDKKISYVPYGLDVRKVKIRDKQGNAYVLHSTGYASDEITFDGDECILIKRAEVGESDKVMTRPYANYNEFGSIGIAYSGGEIEGEPRPIVYELVEYKRIPLSEECANALRGIRTYRDKTIVEIVPDGFNPTIRGYYSKDFYKA